MSEEIKNTTVPSEEKNDWKKWLKVGGILCAIAGASALVLTSLNLLTAPIIEENNAKKQSGGYREIFSNWAANSDPVAIEGNDNLAEYCIAYSDTAKTNQIGYIYTSKTLAVKSFGNVKAMVGISGETDSPVLGKIYLVENSLSYKTTLESGYILPYNSNPGDTTLNNVKCGATFGAEAIKGIINAARDHYSSIGDSFKEDLADDIKQIWGENSGYTVDNSETNNVSGTTYVKKSYSFYEDDTMTGEIGRLYSAKYKGDAGDIYITVSFNEKNELGKLVVTKDTLADNTSLNNYVSAYNSNPSEETLNATNGADSEAVKAMVSEAKTTLTTAGGLKSSSSYFKDVIASSAYSEVSEATALTKDAAEKVNVLRYWTFSKTETTESEEEKVTEVAKVYKIQATMEAKSYTTIESDTVYLLTITGSKDSPALGKMTLLKNEAGGGQVSDIESYFTNFDGSQTSEGVNGSGATYTLKAVWEGIEKAKALYSAE